MFYHSFTASKDTAFLQAMYLCLSLCRWPEAQSSRMCVTLPFASDILTFLSGFLVQQISCAWELRVPFDSKT